MGTASAYPSPLDPAFVPKASITRLPASSPIEDIISVLDRDGGLILTDLISRTELASIATETAAHCPASRAASHKIPNIPSETKLTGGIVGKSPTFAKLCEHPVLTSLRDQILTDSFEAVREDLVEQHRIEPLLSLSITFDIGFNAPRQRLHRDDIIHGVKHDRPFVLNQVSQFACLVAAVDVTRENGATMFVPGSHRWDDDRKPQLDEICFAEMEPGSALVFLACSYHGGGHNSVPDSWRTIHGLFFCRGTLRTEENQFLAVPRSEVLAMSESMQALLGYKKPTTVLGIVDNRDPMHDLKGVLVQANA